MDKEALTQDLIDAVIDNNVTRVGDLLSSGADPNGVLDVANVTALHYAAQNNALAVIPLLVEAGAIVESKTQEGYTPTDIALMHGYPRIAQVLIAYTDASEGSIH